MRILEAVPEDRGLYVCKAENIVGAAQASAIIEVESMFHLNLIMFKKLFPVIY